MGFVPFVPFPGSVGAVGIPSIRQTKQVPTCACAGLLDLGSGFHEVSWGAEWILLR